LAPAEGFLQNEYGLYNMLGRMHISISIFQLLILSFFFLGNVWEWVQGGDDKKRILRGGSFIDSIDGKFNHAVMVSTRQENSGDSSASNTGFRCASNFIPIHSDEEL
jgi:formylglycine-generating enzyme required for sulfatase activity